MNKPRTITLECDELDFDAIQKATAYRQRMGCLPDGGGNLSGRIIAEICRGYLDMLGEWDWAGSPKRDDNP